MLLLNVLEIWSRLGRVRPEVVVAFNGGYPAAESALAAVIAAHLRKLPSMLVIMSQPQPRRGILPGYDHLLDGLVFSFVDMIVLNSARQASVLVQERGAPSELVRTVYNGISDVESSRVSAPLALPEIVLGVVSRLDPMKGLEHLIRALALLDARPTLKLRIVGNGDCRESLQQLAQDLGISERVVFSGFKQGQDLLNELDRFDIYVFPSLWEGLPYSLLEAMRAGLPIVSTDVGGISEAIRNGSEGLLVPPASPERLAAAIDYMLCNSVRALQFGAAARARYEALFSLPKMQEDFAALVTAAHIAHMQHLNNAI